MSRVNAGPTELIRSNCLFGFLILACLEKRDVANPNRVYSENALSFSGCTSLSSIGAFRLGLRMIVHPLRA